MPPNPTTKKDKRTKMIAFGNSLQVSPWGYMGVEIVIPENGKTREEFEKCLKNKEIAIILVSEKIAEELEDVIGSAGLLGPVVLVIPSGFSEEDPAWRALRKLVTEAVGVDLLGKEKR
ncbi:MAG: V-type ATP synthase subunit F, partial [Caldisericia bacterium]|nr:V-type ATP synthase subunit F [Caldisericia bacterium]